MTNKSLLRGLGIKFGGLDIIVILPSKIILYRISGRKKIELKAEINSTIFKRGLLSLDNLEKSLRELKQKYPDLIEAGIFLHLPGLIYQKIALSATKNFEQALSSYLSINLPLALKNYYVFSKIEKRDEVKNIIDTSVFFLQRTLIDTLMIILERLSIVPLFTVHSFNALDIFVSDYFSSETGVDYVFFVIHDRTILTSWIKDYQHFKVLVDEIEIDDLAKLERMLEFYDQLVPADKRELFYISDRGIPENLKTKYRLRNIPLTPDDFWITVGNLIKRRIGKGGIIDILPEKPLKIFFINRLIPILRVISLFIGSLIVFSMIGFFVLFGYFQEKVKSIQFGVREEISLKEKEEKISNLYSLLDNFLKRYAKPLDVSLIYKLKELGEIQKIESNLQSLKVWVIINKDREKTLEDLRSSFSNIKIEKVESKEDKILFLIEK
jgi:hypothetical protein